MESVLETESTKQPLSITHPHLVEQWDYKRNEKEGLFLDKITYGSNKKAFWKCPICKHKWQATIKKRAMNSGKCRKCQGKRSYLVKNGIVEIETINQLRSWISEILVENGVKKSKEGSVGFYFESIKDWKDETKSKSFLCYKPMGLESRYKKLEEITDILKKHKLAKLIKLQTDSILLRTDKLNG